MDVDAIKSALLSWAPVAGYGGLLLALYSAARTSTLSREEKVTQLAIEALAVDRTLQRIDGRLRDMERGMRDLISSNTIDEIRPDLDSTLEAVCAIRARVGTTLETTGKVISRVNDLPWWTATATLEEFRRIVIMSKAAADGALEDCDNVLKSIEYITASIKRVTQSRKETGPRDAP